MLQDLTQEIEETAHAVVNEIHTAMPGEIVSFDAGSGVATVKPSGKFVTSDGKELDYPVITAGVGIAFPVKKGDSCIIIISEVELDAWRSGAESEGSLRFDLTSAMVIPGLLDGGSNLAAKASANNAVMIGGGDVEVSVSNDGIKVDTGTTQFEVTDSGVAISGNLKVNGSISYTGSCQSV